jgi:hypothetical protein
MTQHATHAPEPASTRSGSVSQVSVGNHSTLADRYLEDVVGEGVRVHDPLMGARSF